MGISCIATLLSKLSNCLFIRFITRNFNAQIGIKYLCVNKVNILRIDSVI